MEQVIVREGETSPKPTENAEVFCPTWNGAYTRYVAKDGEWKHAADGDYRMSKDGVIRKQPRYAPMGGYTTTQFLRWLDGQGFAV